MSREGEGGARAWVLLPSLPPLYIGPLGAPALGDAISKGGRRPRGEECLPSQVETSPFRVSPFPCAWALGGWFPWPIKARAPPYSPCYCIGRGGTFSGPPESSGIFWKLPGTIPKKPELFPEPEQQLSIYKSLPPNHSGTPRDVRDLIRDSKLPSIHQNT